MISFIPNRLDKILLIPMIILCASCNERQLPSALTTEVVTQGTQAPLAQPPSSLTQTAIPTPDTGLSRSLFLAHYMPWYQSPAGRRYWGWHWTMNHFRPDQKDESGRPNIASHFTPLTGPYDSSDETILEYQILLMKISGIDGVIVDWYGIENFWDYGIINESTNRLFRMIRKAGLLFSICYEDQSIKHMVDNKHLNEQDVYTHGQEVMRYLQDTWFHQEAYLKAYGRPVLFIFGPQYFANPSDWETLFSVLDPRPVFITLDNHPQPAAMGSFPWPPMWASQNGVLSHTALENYLNTFYQKAEKWEYRVGGAFPGFHDIYKEAGVGNSYGYLDPQKGETFRYTLQTALDHRPNVIQLITWNDYGEGTILEPTQEFGYQYLEIIQTTRKALGDQKFPFDIEDLRLPFQLYNLRQKYAHEQDVQTRLDEVFQALISGNVEEAINILADYP